MEKDDLISRSALLEAIAAAFLKTDPTGEEQLGYLACSRIVREFPGIDANSVRHGRWKHIKKHLWHKDANGDVDMWYVDHGYHNGPGCKICGKSFCEHCDPNWADDECEIGYYVCSECERSTETGDSPYCPNCGAKMDAEVTDETAID